MLQSGENLTRADEPASKFAAFCRKCVKLQTGLSLARKIVESV